MVISDGEGRIPGIEIESRSTTMSAENLGEEGVSIGADMQIWLTAMEAAKAIRLAGGGRQGHFPVICNLEHTPITLVGGPLQGGCWPSV
jgi:hypothetical protein